MNNEEGLKNLQCDICSKQVQNKLMLHTLREIYQTKDVVRVCEECLYVIDKHLYKLQNKCWNGKIEIGDISKELKEFMVKLKDLGEEIGTERFWSRVWLKLFEKKREGGG